jgi:hypothetical protein
MKVDASGALQPITPEDAREIRGYVESHRSEPGPLELVIGGPLPRDLDPYREAGVTWWLEGGPDPEDVRGVLARRPA